MLVWPEHVQALRVFDACATQWRILIGNSGAHYQGVEYTAVESVMRIMHVQDPSECLACVQLIEKGAISVLNSG